MFRLFRKTRWKIEGKVFDFFDELFKQLPTEFHFLSVGLHNGLYRGLSVNYAMKEHHYSINFNPSLSDKSIVKSKQFELQDIFVIQDGQSFSLNLTIYEGLWVGLETKKNISNFTEFQFDISRIHKAESKFNTEIKIERLLSGLTSQDLDLYNLPEIEFDGRCFYQIKDLENGNYIAIDDQGQVFELIHDPFKIDLLNKSIKQFVDDVNNGRFTFEKYLL